MTKERQTPIAVEAAVSAAFVNPAGDTPATTVPSSFAIRALSFVSTFATPRVTTIRPRGYFARGKAESSFCRARPCLPRRHQPLSDGFRHWPRHSFPLDHARAGLSIARSARKSVDRYDRGHSLFSRIFR